MNDISEYLLPDVSEWLVKTFLEDGWIKNEFVIKQEINLNPDIYVPKKRYHAEQIVYISKDCIGTYIIELSSCIKRYIKIHDLVQRTNRIIDVPGYVCLYVKDHPQLLGFWSHESYRVILITLIDILNGDVIHTWSIDGDCRCLQKFHRWDADDYLEIHLQLNLQTSKLLNLETGHEFVCSFNNRLLEPYKTIQNTENNRRVFSSYKEDEKMDKYQTVLYDHLLLNYYTGYRTQLEKQEINVQVFEY